MTLFHSIKKIINLILEKINKNKINKLELKIINKKKIYIKIKYTK